MLRLHGQKPPTINMHVVKMTDVFPEEYYTFSCLIAWF